MSSSLFSGGLHNASAWPAPTPSAQPANQSVHFAQRIEALRQGTMPGGVVPLGNPLRYGSGAGMGSPATGSERARPRDRARARERSDSRERDRLRRPAPFGGRAAPAGPQEEADWLSALSNVQNSIQTIERSIRQHAQTMSNQDQKISELQAVVERHDVGMTETATRNEELHRYWTEFLEKTYAPIVLFEQLRDFSQSLEARLDSLMQFVQSTGRNEAEAEMNRGSAMPPSNHAPQAAPPGPSSSLFSSFSPLRQTAGDRPMSPSEPVPSAAEPSGLDPQGRPLLPVAARPSTPCVPMTPGGPPTCDATAAGQTSPDPMQRPEHDAWHRSSVAAPCPAATSVPMPGMFDRPSQPYSWRDSSAGCAQRGVPNSWNPQPSNQRSAAGFMGGNQYHPPPRHGPQQSPWGGRDPYPAAYGQCPAPANFMPQPARSIAQMGQHMGDIKAMHRKTESLRRWSGNVENFAAWSQHMVDHMSKVHPCWRQVLTWLSTTNDLTDFANLNPTVIGPFDENAAELAQKFEQVIVDYLPEKQYLRRAQLAGGKQEEGNGFTMWRRLHRDNHGEGQIVEYAGTQCLREYGRCRKLEDVSAHIDGWYELFEMYGRELEGAHMMTRGMFLDILPAELRTEILKEPKLQAAGHRALSEWCRNRVLLLTSEKLAEVRKKELTGRSKICSLRKKSEGDTSAPTEPDFSDAPPWAQHLYAMQVAAVKPPPRAPSGPGRPRAGSPRRSPSPGRRTNLIDWGNKCFHCGYPDRTREKCEKFLKMMADHNKSIPKADWKPPPGYKSAIAKARDAAKLTAAKAAPKPKARPIRALLNDELDIEPDVDTASDSDYSSDSDSGNLVGALRRITPTKVHTALPPQSISTVNRFSGLEEGQSYDMDMMHSLNVWAHKVRIDKPRAKKAKAADPEIERSARYITSKTKPSQEQVIVVQSLPDIDQASEIIRPLPSSRKALSKIVKRVSSHVHCEPDERLVMVDSGAFTSAIDAAIELPEHEPIPIPPNEPSCDGESACGGIMKCRGHVVTRGSVEGIPLDAKWKTMAAKVAI